MADCVSSRRRGSWLVRFGATVLLVLLALAVLSFVPSGVRAKSAEYARLDVALQLRPDGSYHVTETQVVRFVGGPYTLGHRVIPLTRTEGIANIRVTETTSGSHPYREIADLSQLPDGTGLFNVWTTSTEARIYWTFESTTSTERTFVVEYDVLGALRVYPNENPPNQQIWWTAVGKGLTAETAVWASKVTVTLPRAVNLAQVVIGDQRKDNPVAHSLDGRVFTWQHGDLRSGDEFTVRMQFPPVVEGARPPSWQAADDAQRAKQATVAEKNAVMHLILLGLGLALVAGGGTGVYGLWYLRGRDPHTGLVAEFLPQPPDDLPPGVAGTLLDERADECDVVATFVDLGRRGVIKMTDVGLVGPLKRETGNDYLLEMVNPDAPLAAFERPLVKAVFGPAPTVGTQARLGDVRGKVVAAYPSVKERLYAELVTRGYFPRSPEATRSRWRKAGLIALVLAVAAGPIAVLDLGWFAVFPACAAIALSLLIGRMGPSMPRKTEAGAEAAAKWRAFRRYLTDIEKYEQVRETKQIFDKFLAYAVAFEIDTKWVNTFARVDTPAPGWVEAGDGSRSRGHSWNGGTTVGSGWDGPTSGGGVDLPDLKLPGVPNLQKASNRASSGIQSGSSGLSDMLNVVGAIFEIAGIFSGGGGGGGSSGGGSGGFS